MHAWFYLFGFILFYFIQTYTIHHSEKHKIPQINKNKYKKTSETIQSSIDLTINFWWSKPFWFAIANK